MIRTRNTRTHDTIKIQSSHHNPILRLNLAYTRRPRNPPLNTVTHHVMPTISGPWSGTLMPRALGKAPRGRVLCRGGRGADGGSADGEIAGGRIANGGESETVGMKRIPNEGYQHAPNRPKTNQLRSNQIKPDQTRSPRRARSAARLLHTYSVPRPRTMFRARSAQACRIRMGRGMSRLHPWRGMGTTAVSRPWPCCAVLY